MSALNHSVSRYPSFGSTRLTGIESDFSCSASVVVAFATSRSTTASAALGNGPKEGRVV